MWELENSHVALWRAGDHIRRQHKSPRGWSAIMQVDQPHCLSGSGALIEIIQLSKNLFPPATRATGAAFCEFHVLSVTL